MTHPSLEEILAGGAAAHVSRCATCRRLAELGGASVVPAAEDPFERLTAVDERVYTDWSPLAEARGGMGRIFRALDRRLGRYVAIKQLHAGLSDVERTALIVRFEREARLTARLQHPAIVGVHEAGRFGDGEPFYAMPLLRGLPLTQEILLRRSVAARLALLPHLTAVADAVAYAHQQGIVHRDIKPDNILIGSFGETVLIDWGLAKDLGEATEDGDGAYRAAPSDGLTHLGVGTPQYMPPEQARGELADARMDVYAVGATLYHTLSGAPPYGVEGGTHVRRALAASAPTPLEQLAPDVPAELSHIVERAMARDPAVRFASAQELADELRRFQTGQLLQSRRYTLGELIRHFARRHRTALRIVALAIVALIVVGVVAFVRIARERDRAAESQARAEHELRRAQSIAASRLAADPDHRIEAIALGVRALGPELAADAPPVPEAFQALTDALAAGPTVIPLAHAGVIRGFAAGHGRLVGIDDANALVVWDERSGRRLASYPVDVGAPERVDVAPDGRYAVVSGFDPIAEVFALDSGQHRRIDAKNAFAGCAFSNDGKLVTAAEDVVIRDPATLEVVTRWPLPAPANAIAVAASGRIVVTTLDRHAWTLPPGGAPAVVQMPVASTEVIAVDHAAHAVVVNGTDQVIRQWSLDALDAAPKDLYATTREHLARTTISPDDRFVTAGLFDVDNARSGVILDRRGSAAPREIDGIAQAWLGERSWAVTEQHGPLAIVDAEDGGTVLALDAHHDHVKLAVDGDHVFSASLDGAAYLWDLVSGAVSGMLLGHTGEIVTVSVRGDAILTASHDGTARIWRASDGTSQATLHMSREIVQAAWLGDQAIVVGDLGGELRVFDRTGVERARAWVAAPISALATTSDGRSIVFGTLDGTLEIRNAELDHPVALHAGAGAITALAISPGDARIASAHGDGSTKLWNARTGELLASAADADPVDEPEDHEGHAALEFSRNGARVFAARPTGHTLVLDVHTLATQSTLDGRQIGGDGSQRVVTASPDGAVFVHDLGTGGHTRLVGHKGVALASAFSADGKRLATASVDGTVQIWNVATGDALASIPGQLGAATALAFVGDWIVTGYASGAVRMHPATREAALERACSVLRHVDRVDEAGGYCDARTAIDRK